MTKTPLKQSTASTSNDSLDVELLKKDHDRFRQIAEINQTVIWEVDVNGLYTYVSPMSEKIFGYSQDELIGNFYFYDLHPADSRDQFRNDTLKAFSSQKTFQDFRNQIVRKDGTIITVATNGVPFYSDSGLFEGYRGSDSDLSTQLLIETKHIEDELKVAFKRTKELQRALDSVPVAVFKKDLNSNYTYANAITREVFGVTLEELDGKNDFDVFDQETALVLTSIDKQVFDGNKTTKEVRTVDRKGVERIYLEIKTPIYDEDNPDVITGLLGVATDITANKLSERVILESEQYLKSVIKAIPDSLFVVNADGVFLDFKADSRDLYVPDGSFIGKKISDIMPPDISAIIYAAIEESLQSTGVVERHYALNIQGNLKQYSSRFVSSGDNKIVATVTDITESYNYLNRIQNLLVAEEEQNKRLRNFTHIVSHNLRSHTANMEGLLYLLEDEYQEIFNNQYIQLLKVSSGNLKDTIQHLNQVLDINLTGDKEWSLVNVKDLVDTGIQSIRQLAINAGVTITNSVDKNLKIEVIPAYLESIVLNLLTNSIKYRSEARESRLDVTSNLIDNTVALKFSDNGLGIDLKRHGDKIFGMYKTFHSNSDSKGLGLFMVKNQVEAMGGTISVTSEVDVGSTFIVHLPHKQIRN